MKKLNLFSNLWRLFRGSRKDNGSTRLRVVFDSFTCRLRVCPLKLVAVFAILLTLGVGNVLGAVTTYTFSSKSWAATSGGSAANWTSNGDGNGFSNNGVQVLGGGSAAATSPTSFTNVTKVVVTYNTNKSQGAGHITIQIGTNDEVTNSAGYSGSSDGRSANFTSTFNFSPGQTGSVELSVEGSTNSLYIVSIEITTAAATKYTVSFSTGTGNPTQADIPEASAGAGVTLPSVTPACSSDGWALYGWATSAVASSTTTAPAIVGKAGDTYYPSSNITLRAVYAKGEYTKITSTSDLNTTSKYFFAAVYSTKNYVMTSSYSSNKLAAKQIDETSSGKYHAASINAEWCYTLESSSSKWFIVDCNSNNSNHYLDTYYADWYGHSKDNYDSYTFSYTSSSWTITNSYGDNKYFGYSSSDGAFKPFSSAQNLLIYKQTTTPYYWSAPTCAACDADPTIGDASLNGSFNLSSVGVSCASSGAGTNCSITEYGWVWSDGTSNTDPTIGGSGVTNSPKTSGAPSGSGGSFTGTLSGSFTLGHTYYYKAYVINGKPATVYSDVQTFQPRSVTFNSNGGSAVATKYVNNGGTLSAPDDPMREHFTFGGWYTDDGTFASAVNWSSAINEDKTYYAKWTEDPYKTVVFKNNDDEIDGYASVKVYVGERPTPPTMTDGHSTGDACDEDSETFYGWTTSTWSGTIATQASMEEDYTVYVKGSNLPVVAAGDAATITYNAVWAESVGVPSNEYQLVTDISQLSAGDKIVIANAGSSSTYLMGKDTVTEAGYQFRKVAQGGTFSISSSKITISTSASSSTDRTNPHVFTVGKSGDYWTFYDPLNSAYISCASDGDSKNGLGYENSLSDAGKWDISISGDNKATILSQIGTSTRNRLQANGNPFSIASSFTCSKNTMTDPYIFRNLATLGYQNYMTTCCDKNITIGTPSITGGGTVTFTLGGSTIAPGDVVETCSAAKNIVVRVTPGSGYECTSLSFSDGTNTLTPSPTTASTLPFGYDEYKDFTLSFSKETTSITLETEVTFSAKALTGWSWKYKKGADAASDGVDPYTIPETVEVYKNEYARFFIVGYDPEDVIDSKKGFVYVSSDDPEVMQPVFDKSELSYSSKNAACSYYQLYGKKVVESSTITFKSAGNASLTKTFTLKVKELPSVTFVDLIHNKSDFTNWGTSGVVSSTVTTGVVTHVKPTPTHADVSAPVGGNSCETSHLHLIGWIRSDYSKVADYMNGAGSEPTVSELTGAGTGYWFTPGADINIETYNGKKFYAVWAVEE